MNIAEALLGTAMIFAMAGLAIFMAGSFTGETNENHDMRPYLVGCIVIFGIAFACMLASIWVAAFS